MSEGPSSPSSSVSSVTPWERDRPRDSPAEADRGRRPVTTTTTPLAIIGRACLLPGAVSPEELWRLAAGASSAIGPPPPGRWAAKPTDLSPGAGGAYTDRGGYVTEADGSWDPESYDLPAGALEGVDVVFRWTLQTVRAALRDAGCPEGAGTGLIMGNLSYPTTGLVRFAESTWLASFQGLGLPGTDEAPNPSNRFMSGLPAALAADALGLSAGTFALDAACASSLYAIKLAGDWLEAGRADVVVAGAVCSSDSFLLHEGFTRAHRTQSDRTEPAVRSPGRRPAAGRGCCLRRAPASRRRLLRAGNRIHGVVRAVGLSNDGRGQGLLVPSTDGQVRALRAAYDRGGIDPETVSYVECHATGTLVGDATELQSMASVFGSTSGMAVGSLKYNIGHLVTVSGVAGLIKVLGAMSGATLPPMPVDEPIEDLDRLGFRAPRSPEEWLGPRRRRDLLVWVRWQQRPLGARPARLRDQNRAARRPPLDRRCPPRCPFLGAGRGEWGTTTGRSTHRHRRNRSAGWPARRPGNLHRCGARRPRRIAVRRFVRGTSPLGSPIHAGRPAKGSRSTDARARRRARGGRGGPADPLGPDERPRGDRSRPRRGAASDEAAPPRVVDAVGRTARVARANRGKRLGPDGQCRGPRRDAKHPRQPPQPSVRRPGAEFHGVGRRAIRSRRGRSRVGGAPPR